MYSRVNYEMPIKKEYMKQSVAVNEETNKWLSGRLAHDVRGRCRRTHR